MADISKEALYAAFKSKDSRFDGRFFVGVKSTGIYCRPVCWAKMPKIENCTFYATAAEAEQAGYRPCLQCRPENAPGFAPVDASASLAHRAAKLLEENCGKGGGIVNLAQRLGCTDRHLRRVFEAVYHVTPIRYLQTCRLLLAKSLLTDTSLSILDVAMASGFQSLRRFNDVFKEQYHLSPTDLRKRVKYVNDKSDSITLALGYRPPYCWDLLLDFLSLRAIPGVEKVCNGIYARTVHLLSKEGKDIYGWVEVKNQKEKNALAVTLSGSLISVLPTVLARVRNLFDLHCDPVAVSDSLSCLNEIFDGLLIPGIRIPGCFDPFEMSVRAVLGQQITVKAATTLAGRFAKAFGHSFETNIEGLTTASPMPQDILRLDGDIDDSLGTLGIIATRARTIEALAKIIDDKNLDFECCADPEKVIKELVNIPGVGAWTANYIAMRTLNYTDAFPGTDLGVKKILAPRKQKEILNLAESWRPWRAYATMCLWNHH